MEFFGELLEVIGTVLIAYAALRVHHRFLHEHAVDEQVFKTMKVEQRIGVSGVILVITGFILRLFV